MIRPVCVERDREELQTAMWHEEEIPRIKLSMQHANQAPQLCQMCQESNASICPCVYMSQFRPTSAEMNAFEERHRQQLYRKALDRSTKLELALQENQQWINQLKNETEVSAS